MGSGLKKIKPEVKKPKLVVFDLGYAVWDYYIECSLEPPFRKDENGQLMDQKCRYVGHRPEVPEILKKLNEEDGYELAAVSTTPQAEEAIKLLGLLEWEKYFTYKQINSETKVDSFARLKATSGLEYSDMIYFSDDITTQSQIEKLGVLVIPTFGGVTKDIVNIGLKTYSAKSLQSLASPSDAKNRLDGATGDLKDRLGGATGDLKDGLGGLKDGATGDLKDRLGGAAGGLAGNLNTFGKSLPSLPS